MNKPSKFNELQQKLLSDMFKQQFDKMTINNFIFEVCYDNDKLGKANIHYHNVINRLSRKIQNKNKRIKELELEVHKLRHYRLIHHIHYGKTSNQVFFDELTKGSDNNDIK